ncbi:MAG: CapA family protein [Myxococcales bacterium]|nr:CapA family protein [Myxococcales bacterium]
MAPVWLVAAVLASAPQSDAGVAPEARCAPAALEQVETGRKIQREKGEGGADEAIASYRAALEADPSCAPARWELGWSHQVKGEWDAAVAAWDALRKSAPDYPELDRQYEVAQRRREQAASLAALPDPGKLPAVALNPSEGEPITFAAVGDVHMGTAWPPERAVLPPDGGADLFEAVAPALQDADVTFGNLETVLADSGDSAKCGPKSTKCFAFRAPTAYAKVLRSVGFDVMSIANNHAGDFGPEGRKATIAALDHAGILHSGPIGDIASFAAKGRRVALVAFSTGADVYRVQELDTARRLVADLSRRHDLVVVSFHAGAEGTEAQRVPKGREVFYGEDRGEVRKLAHLVVDAGADLVLGHGPHVLRGAELYRGRLVLYSMGNFSSWQTFGLAGPKGISALFKATLAPNGVALSLEAQPLFLEEPGRPRPDPEKRAIELLRRLSKQDFGEPLLDEAGQWRRKEGRTKARAAAP